MAENMVRRDICVISVIYGYLYLNVSLSPHLHISTSPYLSLSLYIYMGKRPRSHFGSSFGLAFDEWARTTRIPAHLPLSALPDLEAAGRRSASGARERVLPGQSPWVAARSL